MQNGTRALATVLSHAEYRTLEGQTHDVGAKALAPMLNEFFGSTGCPTHAEASGYARFAAAAAWRDIDLPVLRTRTALPDARAVFGLPISTSAGILRFVQRPNHFDRQRAPTAEDLVYAGSRADERLKGVFAETELFQTKEHCRNCVWLFDVVVLALVGFDQRRQYIKSIEVVRPGLCVPKTLNFGQGVPMIGIGSDGVNCHDLYLRCVNLVVLGVGAYEPDEDQKRRRVLTRTIRR